METPKLKPDLLAASSCARRPTQDKRILAQLEHGLKAPARPARATGWSIDGWTIGLFALLLVMCSVAWLMHDKRITPETFRSDTSSAVERSAATPARATRAPDDTSAAEQAAAIVNMSAADPASPQPVAISAGATTQTPTAATAAIANTAASQPVRVAAAQHKSAAPARPAASSASATAQAQPAGDTDVTLLTALVAHANKPSTVTPERSRDVIERQEGDTTAQLLARCKQLGLIEGMLCRSRICSGRWESDAACRAPSH
ncbi:hypothetical protein [Duganella alba]|uniref:hypothetical protein n=1 Tax=Duganella alba TaxID=2666081 RepID=UPI00140C57D9